MSWTNFIYSGSAIVGALAVLSPLVKWALKHVVADVVQTHVKPVTESVTAIQTTLATQFGGNGGGMRQAINEIKTEVAELRGEFHQHVREVA